MKVEEGSLAEFLRAKRASLPPRDVGLPEGARRRTQGLRREEVASLASIGTSWYTALEQGRDIRPSGRVLAQLATALRLNSAETRHLFSLGGRVAPPDTAGVHRPIGPSLQRLLDTLDPMPAVIGSRCWDWLAWNKAAEAYYEFTGDPPQRRNVLWHFFAGDKLIPEAEWELSARFFVASLRGQHIPVGADSEFSEFVRELMKLSDDFRRIWSLNDVQEASAASRQWHHPRFGKVDIDLAVLPVPMVHGSLVISMLDESTSLKLRNILDSRPAKG